MNKEEFAHSIDLTPLYNKIREMLNSPELGFTTEINNAYIKIKSNDILAKTGIFALAINECIAETFNSSVHKEEATDDTPEYMYCWGTIDLRYRSHSGGSNGMEILRFDYNYKNSGEWNFKEARNNE